MMLEYCLKRFAGIRPFLGCIFFKTTDRFVFCNTLYIFEANCLMKKLALFSMRNIPVATNVHYDAKIVNQILTAIALRV